MDQFSNCAAKGAGSITPLICIGAPMRIHLHKNATTTPAQRAYIQNNPHLSVAHLAERTGVSKTTVRRWRNRSDVFDRPHTPKRVKSALTAAQEIKTVICRLATRSSLDDLHNIQQTFLDIHCSRASLNRCLKRYEISRMPPLQRSLPFSLRDYTGTYFYYTCFQLPQASLTAKPLVLHTLLDCTFKFFFADVSSSTQVFLSRHIREFPLSVIGIIHEDPINLTWNPHGFGPGEQAQRIRELCSGMGLGSHHLPAQFPNTVNLLKETLEAASARDLKGFFDTEVHTLGMELKGYNSKFSLGSLKKKTPHQALETHYTHFPNSFKQRPDALTAPA